jgi:hypothetical protein
MQMEGEREKIGEEVNGGEGEREGGYRKLMWRGERGEV